MLLHIFQIINNSCFLNFLGTYDYSLGTNIFFTENPKYNEELDPILFKKTKKMFSYMGKSTKVLQMQRIFVQPVKQTNDERKPIPESTTEDISATSKMQKQNRCKLEKSYSEALDQLLLPGEKPPRQLLPSDYAIPGEKPDNLVEQDEDDDNVYDSNDADV